ncbi:MAG: NADH-quinone oxidoreductase subunit D [Armatimonadetes bacterium]|nr:NADH-quinone oxidoreductase subunit D [Armatimonadota bacterium]
MTTVEILSQGMVINVGPQHPSTHGVLRLILTLDGEQIVACEPVIGYLHRGLEKMMERRPYRHNIPFTDRLDYLAALSNNLAICQCIERLGGVEVPERAQYIRVLLMELQRIASHLVFVGTFGTDLGATTMFLYAFREREMVLDLLEECTGARLTYNWVRVGGVPDDLPEGFGEKVLDFVKVFRQRLDEYDRLLTRNRIFRSRTQGIGVLPKEMALACGCSGPVARASGVAYDIRKVAPYEVYDRVEFEVPVLEDGDVWARYLVRMEEMRQSLRIIEQVLRDMPEGPVLTKLPKVFKPPAGIAYSRVESPRGELSFMMVSDGSPNPVRVHIRAPSFVNLSVLPRLLEGAKVADLVAILGSIDVVLGEIDR